MRTITVLSGVVALSLNLIASSASAGLLIKVNKSTQTLTVIRDGATLHTWPVSTGRTGFATPSGNFIAYRMEAKHFSKEWDDAPMPHSVFFTKQGHAIHGSYDVKRLGSPASHGCVRLAPANAAKLFLLVKQEGLSNTQVVLTGSEQVALAHKKSHRVARRDGDTGSSRVGVEDRAFDAGSIRYPMHSYTEPQPGSYYPQEYRRSSEGYQPSPYVQRQDQYGHFDP